MNACTLSKSQSLIVAVASASVSQVAVIFEPARAYSTRCGGCDATHHVEDKEVEMLRYGDLKNGMIPICRDTK